MVCRSVVCLKWGDKYPSKYVNNLWKGLQKTPNAHLICVTDDPEGIDPAVEIIPLPETNLQGWWNKLLLFELDLPSPVLYLDLDVIVADDLTPLFDYEPDKPFVGVLNFAKTQGINSSVMRFSKGAAKFNTASMKFTTKPNPQAWQPYGFYGEYFGDQELIRDTVFPNGEWKDNVYPNGWIVSYKYNQRQLKDGNKIVVFHGDPKPSECDGWVKDYWT